MKKVIIIGSGIGGLIAGNLLLKKGFSVTIFEAHSSYGGYTAGFYRKGCYFESGTVGFESSPTLFKALKDIGVYEEDDFIRVGTRIVCESFKKNPENFTELKNTLLEACPLEKTELEQAFSALDEILSAFKGKSEMIMPSVLSRKEFFKYILKSIRSMPKLISIIRKYGNVTSSEFAAKYFEKGTFLYDFFNNFTYPNASAVFVATAMDGVLNDIWTVKGGMQALADVLAKKFKEQGGILKLNSYVSKIITKDQTAVGVSCKDIFYEADYVISDGDYKKTLLSLLDNKNLIPVDQLTRVQDAAVSEGFFTVYLVLDIPNDELQSYMQHPHVFYLDRKPGYDILNDKDEEFFGKSFFYLFSPSLINHSHSPQGKSSLMIQSRSPIRWMDNWGAGSREVYKQLKEKTMNTLIDRAARYIPNLKERIEYKDAATPLTYERFTYNSDGASSAWSWDPQKSFYNSSISTNIKTPVKNLFIGSSWAIQIGGIPGAIAAAYTCAKKIK